MTVADGAAPGLISVMERNLAAALRLMVVTDDRLLAGQDLAAACQSAVRGGATAIQLRLKQASGRELAGHARALLKALPVPIIVNDRADVALAVGAHGVHLGPDDVPAILVRRLAPPGFLIGVSVGLEREIPNGMAADYWGIGPYRPSTTKADAGAALGLTGFCDLMVRAEGRPCMAIGGVRPEDVGDILAAGGAGVAVVSGVFGEGDPETAASRYRTG